MKRRIFIKNTAISAAAVSAFGFIRFDGEKYVGDCETTTDILGPFYRPNSPLRQNLLMGTETGTRIQLTGMVKHNDCVSPYKKAKIELWHCDDHGVYDNASTEFRYRGTTYSDNEGRYSFDTVLPVSYDAGGGLIRPAHFHLMVTAEGYQPLVTQLYFSGDKNIEKDPSAAAPSSKRRILDITDEKDGSKKVMYDVSMAPTLAIEAVALQKLLGTYTDVDDPNNKKELFEKDNGLWLKNEVFGERYEYMGNNKFEYPGLPDGSYGTLEFELKGNGNIQLTIKEAYGPYINPVLVLEKNG